jgi:putative FmdB family regulatory protein
VPIYEYRCAECEHAFEELAPIGAPAPACPSCGAERSERLLSSSVAAPRRERFDFRSVPFSSPGGCCGGACAGHRHQR